MKRLKDIHQGDELEKLRVNTGMKFAELARRAKMSPPTLKKYFKKADFCEKMFYRLGMILQHDFAEDYPELLPVKESLGLGTSKDRDALMLHKRYQALQQRHIELVRLLARIANKYDLTEFGEAVDLVCMSDVDRLTHKTKLKKE